MQRHRALALQLLLLLLHAPLLCAQGPNFGAAPGAVWPSFGGTAVGGRAVVGGVVGPTAIQPLSAQAWSSWSGTSAASLAAGPNGVLIYYTQGGMAPIGSIVRGRSLQCSTVSPQLCCAACACCCLCCCCCCARGAAPPPLPQLIRAHLSPPYHAGVHSARPVHLHAGHPPLQLPAVLLHQRGGEQRLPAHCELRAERPATPAVLLPVRQLPWQLDQRHSWK